jgi:hypothetical protein
MTAFFDETQLKSPLWFILLGIMVFRLCNSVSECGDWIVH